MEGLIVIGVLAAEPAADRVAVGFAEDEPPGLRGWSLPTGGVLPEREVAEPAGWLHVDHVVALTPDLDATVEALVAAGLDHRRTRDAGPPARGVRQAFFLVRPTLLELGGPAPDLDGPAFWGLTLVAGDLDAAAERLGDRLGRVKDAVQPGQEVEVRILKIEPEAKKLSLSLRPLPVVAPSEPDDEADDTPPVPKPPRKTPLKGGLGDQDPDPFADPPGKGK